MNLVLKHSGGGNLVVRPQARPAWYPTDRSRPVQVQVWWHYEGESAAASRSLGTFAPGQAVTVPSNPLVDRNFILRTITISGRGVPSVRDIADAPATLLVVQRETSAPTVAQVGAATHTNIRLAIDGFSTLAIKRRVRIADDVGMSTGLQVLETTLNPGEVLSRLIDLTRTDGGSGTRTVYVRISHSSGGDYGAESTVASFTYANSGGTGGGTGSEDPFPHREYTVP